MIDFNIFPSKDLPAAGTTILPSFDLSAFQRSGTLQTPPPNSPQALLHIFDNSFPHIQ